MLWQVRLSVLDSVTSPLKHHLQYPNNPDNFLRDVRDQYTLLQVRLKFDIDRYGPKMRRLRTQKLCAPTQIRRDSRGSSPVLEGDVMLWRDTAVNNGFSIRMRGMASLPPGVSCLRASPALPLRVRQLESHWRRIISPCSGSSALLCPSLAAEVELRVTIRRERRGCPRCRGRSDASFQKFTSRNALRTKACCVLNKRGRPPCPLDGR